MIILDAGGIALVQTHNGVHPFIPFIVRHADNGPFVDERTTASGAAANVKQNLQLGQTPQVHDEANKIVCAAICLRRRAGAGAAAICEVSAAPAPARSTFFCSVMKHLNNPLVSGLDQCLKKL